MSRQDRPIDLARALASELVSAGNRATMGVSACKRILTRVEDLHLDRVHALDYACHRARALADADADAADSALALASSLINAQDRERARDLVGALTSAQGRARDLAKELARVTNLILSLAEMLSLGLASSSDYALANVRALTSNHTLARFCILPNDFIRRSRAVQALASHYARVGALTNGELDLARVLDQNLRYDLDHLLRSARGGFSRSDLALAVDRAADLEIHLDRVLGSFVGVDRVLDRAKDLQRTLEVNHATNIAANLSYNVRSIEYGADTSGVGGVGSMPGRVPRGLVSLAIQMLPAPQRPRYRVEFGTELAELSSRERLGYARRVLAGAWELRRALVEARRNAEAAARRAEE